MNYTCPYCGHHSTITDPNRDSFWRHLGIRKPSLGDVGIEVSAITCPNAECHKLNVVSQLTGARHNGANWVSTDVTLKRWQLMPESEAKVFPEYVPAPIRNDYYEACRIRSLSPKAAATLARRCLQGMIRDFHGITKNRLVDEIKELEGRVDADVWESIEAVRSVGNIGAHMEKDINLIVDVDPDEAQLLLGLIEQLTEEWYIARESRRVRATKLKELAATKKAERKEAQAEAEAKDDN